MNESVKKLQSHIKKLIDNNQLPEEVCIYIEHIESQNKLYEVSILDTMRETKLQLMNIGEY